MLKAIRLREDDLEYELIFDFMDDWHVMVRFKKGISLVEVMKSIRALHFKMEDRNDKVRHSNKKK